MSLTDTLERTSLKTIKDIPTPVEHRLKGSIGIFEPDKFHHYIYKLEQQYGSIFKIHFFNKPVVVVSDPKAVQYILKNRPGQFRRASQVESVFNEMGINGAFSAEGEEWSRHRKMLNPAFNPSQLKLFYASIYRSAQRLVKAVERSRDKLDFQQIIERYTTDITTELSFGYDFNSLSNPDSTLQKNLSFIFPMISKRLKMPFPYWRYYKLKQDRDLDKALVEVRKFATKFIEEAKIRVNQTGESQNILESMVLHSEGGDEDIYGNIITLLLAGEDTTANTIAWAIDYLADLPELQDEIFEEIKENYPSSGKLEWEHLESFPLTFGAAQESLRLKPVAPYLYIEGKNDEEICGYTIPKGTTIITLMVTQGFSEALFPHADDFAPQRWLDMSEADLKHHGKTLLPFGFGPRVCPGRKLSFIELKLALIELLARYKFVRAEGYGKAYESFLFTVKPNNLYVKATLR